VVDVILFPVLTVRSIVCVHVFLGLLDSEDHTNVGRHAAHVKPVTRSERDSPVGVSNERKYFPFSNGVAVGGPGAIGIGAQELAMRAFESNARFALVVGNDVTVKPFPFLHCGRIPSKLPPGCASSKSPVVVSECEVLQTILNSIFFAF